MVGWSFTGSGNCIVKPLGVKLVLQVLNRAHRLSFSVQFSLSLLYVALSINETARFSIDFSRSVFWAFFMRIFLLGAFAQLFARGEDRHGDIG